LLPNWYFLLYQREAGYILKNMLTLTPALDYKDIKGVFMDDIDYKNLQNEIRYLSQKVKRLEIKVENKTLSWQGGLWISFWCAFLLLSLSKCAEYL
jgi:hypothetical protein